MPKKKEKTEEKNIYKQTDLSSGRITYVIDKTINKNRYQKSFESINEAKNYLEKIKQSYLKNKPIKPSGIAKEKNRKRTKIETNIIQQKDLNTGNIIYIVNIKDKKKQYLKYFKTLKEAKEYKEKLYKELGKKEKKYTKTGQHIGKKIKIDKNILKDYRKYKVELTIDNINYYKSFNTLEEAKKYRDTILKKHDEKYRLKKTKKEKKKKIIPKKKEIFEKPKIYKRKPRTKKILGQYTLPTEDDELLEDLLKLK